MPGCDTFFPVVASRSAGSSGIVDATAGTTAAHFEPTSVSLIPGPTVRGSGIDATPGRRLVG